MASPVSVLSDFSEQLYARVKLTLQFREKMLAGLPSNEEMLDYFVKAKQMSDAEKEDFIARIQGGALSEDEKAEMKETSWTVFERDREGHLCVWHNNIKAMLRECMTTLGVFIEKRPSLKKGEEAAGGKQTYQHGLVVEENRVKLLSDFEYQKQPDGKLKKVSLGAYKPMTRPHGYIDRVKHISDASGKRSALGRHDFVDEARLVFVLKWVDTGVYSIDDLKRVWAACQEDGLGACRSSGYGRFDCIEWEVLKAPKPRKAKVTDEEAAAAAAAEAAKKSKL